MRRIYLDNINKEDMPSLYRWFSDIEFLTSYDYVLPIPMTKEKVEQSIADYNEENNSIIFAIRATEDAHNPIIGVAGYYDIIKDNQVATLFIGIGDKNQQGKGYGKKALDELLNYGFKILKLHRIQLNVMSFNASAIALYEKAGFKKEGIMKEFVLRDGKRHDLYMYAKLKTD
jgi:RimJ/RimL family protein N-acetyltransferase